MSKVTSWATEEVVVQSILHQNLGGYSATEARDRVRDGLSKWAMCQGGILTLVPPDYKLLMWEWFMKERQPNVFEKADG